MADEAAKQTPEEPFIDPGKAQQDQWGATAIEWLEDKWREPRLCPICEVPGVGWTVGLIGQIRTYTAGPVRGDQVLPLVPVMCNNCGYTFFIAAIQAGVVPREDPRPEGGRS